MKVKKAAKSLLWASSAGAVVGAVAFTAVGDSQGVNNSGKFEVVTEAQYIKYLWHSDFDESFVYQALKAIDWSESKTGVLKAGAFANTEIPRDYILPQQLSKIEDEAFKGATLKDGFKIPETVVSIGHRAFEGANIAFRFNFTSTTEEIGVDAFKDLKLQDGFDFIVPNWHTLMNLRKGGYENSTDGGKIILSDDFTIVDDIVQISQNTFHNVVLPYTFTIPESVYQIDEQSFKNAYLPLEFKIPETLFEIHENAFDSIVLHDGYVVHDWTTLTGLRKGGYGYENHLRLGSTFTTPSNYDEIGEMDFYNVQLPDKFSIPESVETIHPSAFVNSTVTMEFVVPNWHTLRGLRDGGIDYDTQLPLWSEFQIPANIRSIDDVTFRNTVLPVHFTVPEMDDIDPQAFANVTLDEGFKIWDWNTLVALRTGGLSGRLDVDKSFSIPRSVEKITSANFNNLNLPWNFSIPDSTEVEAGTFANISLDDKFVLKDWWTLKGLKKGGYTNQKPLVLSHDFTIQRFDDPNEIWDGVFDNVAIQEGFFVKDYWTIRGLQLGGYDEIHGRLVLWSDFTIDESVVVDPTTDSNVFATVGVPSNFLVKDWWTLKGLRLGGLDDDRHLFLAPEFEIPAVETTIHEFAFYNTTLPEGFTIPDTITSIREKSFWHSVLSKGFTIPEAVHVNGGLSSNAFTETTLKVGFTADDWWTLRGLRQGGYRYEKNIALARGFTVPDNVSIIVDRAFENTTLPDEFSLNANILSIGRDAFKRTTLPVGFKIFNSKAVVHAEAFSKNTTIASDFEVLNWWTLVGLRMGGYAYTNPLILTKDFVIPDEVTSLNTTQFENVTIQTGFTIPRHLIETEGAIAPDTFTKLLFLTRDFVVLDYWTLIGLRMGGYDAELNDDLILDDDFEVPADTDIIYAYAFYRTVLPANFSIKPGVHTIMEHAFKEVKLPLGFKIPDTAITIDRTAFNTSYFEDVKKYEVPDYWTLIGLRKGGFGVELAHFDNYSVEYYIQLTLSKDFVFPNVVTDMIDRAFELTVVPAGFTLNVDGVTLKTIGQYAFRRTNLPFNFEIPQSAISTGSIEGNAFSDSTLLGNSGSSFVVNDYWTLRGLRKGGYGVVYNNSNGEIDYFNLDLTLHASFEIPEGVTIVEAHAFERTITSNAFTLFGTEIVEIQKHAFRNTSLKHLFKINKEAITIAKTAFSQTTLVGDNNSSFKVSDWWTLIGLRKGGYGVEYISDQSDQVREYITYLTLIDTFSIPDEISEISARTFEKVLLPTNFRINSTITSIKAHAFKDTTLNVGLTIPKETIEINDTSFASSILGVGYKAMDWWTLLGLREGGFPYSKIIVLHSEFKILDEIRIIESHHFKNVQLQSEFEVPKQFIYDSNYSFASDAFSQINDSTYGGTYTGYYVSNWWTLNALRYGGNVDLLELSNNFIIPGDDVDPSTEDNILLIREKVFADVLVNDSFVIPKEFIEEGGTKKIHQNAFVSTRFSSSFKIKDWWTMRGVRVGGSKEFLILHTNYSIDDLVTNIPDNAFDNFELNIAFKLPERFISVSNKVQPTSFAGVILPNSFYVKDWWTLRGFRIGGYSYENSLDIDRAFAIPKNKNITHIDAQAFDNANINWVTTDPTCDFWGDVTSIGDRAFAYASTIAFVIPTQISAIAEEAFYDARFNGIVNYDPSITFVPRSAFESANFMTKLIIGSRVVEIREKAFMNSSITGLFELGAEIEAIKANAFNGTFFQSPGFVIHEDVAEVGLNSFNGATFPSTYKVTKWWTYKVMRKGAQGDRLKLDSAFSVPETEVSYVRSIENIFSISQIELEPTYRVSDWWTLISLRDGEYDYPNALTLRNGFAMPSHVNTITARAFENVTIQSGFNISMITTISDDAFKKATFKGAFAVPATVTSVGLSAFQESRFEVSLSFGASINEIRESTFEQASIKSITLTNNQTTVIGVKAFFNAAIESEFTLPNWITHVKKQSFNNEYALGPNMNTFKMLSSHITTIDELAFKNSKISSWSSSATSVTIGISAFEQSEFLSNFSMPTNITTISDFAFRNATFNSSIVLSSDALTTIETGAFQSATFRGDFKVTGQVDNISSNAFASMNFSSSYKVNWWYTYKALRRGNYDSIITLHKDFSVLEDELSYVQGMNDYFAESAIYIDKEYTLSDWWTLRALREGNYPIANKLIAKTGFTIPFNVTTIGTNHARNVEFQSGFTIPLNVVEIANSGFSYSKFKGNFVIPANITTMGQYTFGNSTFEGTVDYSASLAETAHSAFKDASFARAILFNNQLTTSIGTETFMNATYGGVKFSLPSRITSIRTSAFETAINNILSIEMVNSSLTLIENRGFANANIVSWTTSQSDIMVGVSAFNSSIFETTFAFPSGVTTLGVDAFRNAQFKGDIILPDTIQTIGDSAFQSARFAKDFDVAQNVNIIGSDAFLSTTFTSSSFKVNLWWTYKALRRGAYAPSIWLDPSFSVPKEELSYVHSDSNMFNSSAVKMTDYTVFDWWTLRALREGGYASTNTLTLRNDFVIPIEVDTILNSMFINTVIPVNFSIPSNITTIEMQAFKQAQFLGSLSIRDTVNSVGTFAFNATTFASNVDFDASISALPTSLFDGASIGGNVNITNTQTKVIGSSAFANTTLTRTFQVPSWITSIGSSAFHNSSAPNGKTVVEMLNSQITTISDSALRGITISQWTSNATSVTIGSNAFYFTEFSPNFVMPTNITTIGNDAFGNAWFRSNILLANITSVATGGFSRATFDLDFEVRDQINSISTNSFNGITFKNNSIENWWTYKALRRGNYIPALTLNSQFTIPKDEVSIIASRYFEDNSQVLLEDQYSVKNWWTLEGLRKGSFVAPLTLSSDFKVPDEVTFIDSNAMQNITLNSSFFIPSQVTTIKSNAFRNSTFTGDFTVPSTVNVVETLAFYASNFQKTFTYNGGGSDILTKVFETATFTGKATIGTQVTTLQTSAFDNASFAEILTLPNSLISIGNRAFYRIDPTAQKNRIGIPASVTSIGTDAFYNTSITAWASGSSNVTVSSTAFKESTFETNVNLPTKLASIGTNAFESAVFESNITIPSNVASIGTNAFLGADFKANLSINSNTTTLTSTSFKNIKVAGIATIGNAAITTIGANAFDGAKFTNKFTLPETITTIGNEAFKKNAATSSTFGIPSSVTTIGTNAFDNQIIDSWNSSSTGGSVAVNTSAFNYATFTSSFRMPTHVASIGTSAFRYATFNGPINFSSALTSVGGTAFEYASINSTFELASLPTTINTGAFRYLSFNATPFSVTNWYTFEAFRLGNYTTKLKLADSFKIPENVSSTIAVNRFSSSNVELPSSFRVLDWWTLIGMRNGSCVSQLTLSNSFIIPSNVNTITTAITDTIIPSGFTLPSNVTTISSNAFTRTIFNGAFTIPNTVTSLGTTSAFINATFNGAFTLNAGSSIASIPTSTFENATFVSTIAATSASNSLTSIGSNAFKNAKLSSEFAIPSSVKVIGADAFSKADISISRNKFTIPSSLTTINANAFKNASFENAVVLPATFATMGTNAFENVIFNNSFTSNADITYIESSAFKGASFRSTATWSDSSLTDIRANAFENATFAQTFTIPNSVTQIGASAFSNLTNKNTFVVSSGVNSIGTNAFKNQVIQSWNSVSASVKTISTSAFENATFSTNFTIPAGWASLNKREFAGVTFSGKVTIPTTVTTIGSSSGTSFNPFGGAIFNNGILFNGPISSFNNPFANVTISSSYRVENWYTIKTLRDGGYTPTLTVVNSNFSFPANHEVETYQHWKWLRDASYTGMLTLGVNWSIPNWTVVNTNDFANSKTSVSSTYKVPNYNTLKGLRDGSYTGTLDGTTMTGVPTISDFATYKMIRDTGYTARITVDNSFTIPSNTVIPSDYFTSAKITLPSGFKTLDWYTLKGLREGGYTGTLTVSDAFTLPVSYACESKTHWDYLREAGFNGRITVDLSFVVPSNQTNNGYDLNNKIVLPFGYRVPDYTTLMWLVNGGYTGTLTAAPSFVMPSDVLLNTYAEYQGIRNIGFNGMIYVSSSFQLEESDVVTSTTFAGTKLGLPSGYRVPNYWTLKKLREGGFANTLSIVSSGFSLPSNYKVESYSDWTMLREAGYNSILTLGNNFTIPSNATITPTTFDNSKVNILPDFRVRDWTTFEGLRDGGYVGTLTVSNDFTLPADYKANSWSQWEMLQGIGYNGNVTLGTNFTIPSNATIAPGSFANNKITLESGFAINDLATIKGLRDGGYTGTLAIGGPFMIMSGTSIPANLFSNSTTTIASTYRVKDVWTLWGLRDGGYTGTLTLSTTFAIDQSVTTLGANSFANVVLNTSFRIPPSVTSIDEAAFTGATLNGQIISEQNPLTWGSDTWWPNKPPAAPEEPVAP